MLYPIELGVLYTEEYRSHTPAPRLVAKSPAGRRWTHGGPSSVDADEEAVGVNVKHLVEQHGAGLITG